MVEFHPKRAARACMGRAGVMKRWGNCALPAAHRTPSYLLYTRAGHVPNVTWRLVERHLKFRQQPVVQLTLPSMYDLLERVESSTPNPFNIPVGFAHHLSPLDPLGRRDSGYNNNSSIAIWVKNCRTSLVSTKFVAILHRLRVDSFSTLFDYDTPREALGKRLLKSVTRSLALSGELSTIEEPLPVVSLGGGFSSNTRQRFAREFLAKATPRALAIDLSAFSANPLVEGRSEAFDEREISALLGDTIMMLPNESLRLAEGAFSPPQICFLAGLGVDLFDSSYAVLLAEQGKAFRLGDGFPRDTTDFLEINLNEKRYVDDFSRLVDGCECYACVNYTKAYVQHLQNTKEMLVQTLLTMHNLMEFDRMFERIRAFYDESGADIQKVEK